MQFKKILPYKLKRILPILGVAGVGVVSSCEKVGPTEPDVPTTSIEYLLSSNGNNFEEYLPTLLPFIQSFADQEYIDTIYLNADYGSWIFCTSSDIQRLRNQFLEPAINYSPKVFGRGNFSFMPGEASKVPDDSTWFVKHGWTLNQQQR